MSARAVFALFAMPSLLVGAACAQHGGPLAGPADTHCGGRVQRVDARACHGAEVAQTPAEPLNNTDGDDDQCKYHVHFTNDLVELNHGTSFTVTVTSKVDDSPVVGAALTAQANLGDLHVLPPSTSTETSPGSYRTLGIIFDEIGTWTVRFNFFPDCVEGETSPRAQVGFFIDVLK